MIATITNTNIDIVRSAIKIFTQLHMMDVMDDGTYHMKEVCRMLGSESYWAQKKREQKEREAIQGQSVGNFPIESNDFPTSPSKRKSKSKTIDKDNKNNVQNKPTKTDIDCFFDYIWSLYPVKKGKGQVSAAKKAALYDIGPDEMKRAINRYLEELQKDAAWRKPQNGSTFFNSGYVDYLDANFKPDEVPEKQGSKTSRTTGFHNFTPRNDSDWDDIEKMAQQRQQSLLAEHGAEEEL